jgi:hypothetical protein
LETQFRTQKLMVVTEGVIRITFWIVKIQSEQLQLIIL